MVAPEAGIDEKTHIGDLRHDGIAWPGSVHVGEREVRLHTLDLAQVVLSQDLDLVEFDQPAQAHRGGVDGDGDVHSDGKEYDRVDCQTDNDFSFHPMAAVPMAPWFKKPSSRGTLREDTSAGLYHREYA